MAGKGLESLIPKKKNQRSDVSPLRPATHTQQPKTEQKISQIGNASTIGKSYSLNHLLHPIHREPASFEKPRIPTEEAPISIARHQHMPFPARFEPLADVSIPIERKHSRRDSGVSEAIFFIEVDSIKPNPYQPRHEFNKDALEELSQSIREFGVLQPLVVSKIVRETETGTGVEYQLIAGERRLRAARLAGLERVPAVVRPMGNERTKLELALIENIQRSDLSSLESAKAYARLHDEFGLTQREIAVRVGKSRETVANTLRLLNLPPEIQMALREGKINESHARTLLTVSDDKERAKVAAELLTKPKSVRALREHVSMKGDAEHRYWERQLEEKIGSPVKIMRKGSRGRVVIQFYSDEEWKRIFSMLIGGDAES